MGEDSDEAEPENGPAGNTSALTADLSVGTRAARDFSAARPTPYSSARGHAMRRREAGRSRYGVLARACDLDDAG